MCIVHVRLCATGSVCILSFTKQGDNIQQVKRNMNQKEESCKWKDIWNRDFFKKFNIDVGWGFFVE